MRARTKARRRALDILFEADLREVTVADVLADRRRSAETAPIHDYTVQLVDGVAEHREPIDHVIAERAEGWTLPRMPAVDRAILRIGVYELLWADDVPDAVAIDEALGLATAMSTDDSPRFINGVLGGIATMSEQLRAAHRTAH